MRIVYITANNAGEAKKISHHLLQKRFAACANIFPIESMYWWQGDIEDTVEYVILVKTKDENYEQIEKAVKELNENDIPAIYSWKVDKISKDYSDWIEKEMK